MGSGSPLKGVLSESQSCTLNMGIVDFKLVRPNFILLELRTEEEDFR